MTLLFVVVLEADRRIVGSRRLGVGFFEVPIFVGRSTDTFLTNFFVVQAWGFHETLSWNYPAWFVSAEYFLYLVGPVLMLFVGGRFGGRAAALGVASFVFLVALAETSGVGLDMTSRYGLWRGLADFGIGLALGALFLACQNKEVGGRPLPASAHTLAQIGTLATVAAGLCLSGPARTPLDLVIAVPIFALIFLLAFDKGLIARALHAPGLMKLGEWSFAIYMVHYIAMYFLPSFGLPERPWLTFIGGLAASIAAGALAWRVVERPLGEAMRRRLLSAWGRVRAG